MNRRALFSTANRAILPALVFVLTTLPIVLVLMRSFQSQGEWTIEHYRSALGGRMFLKSLLNTLIIALGVVVVSTAMGVPTAWLVTRTDIRFRRILRPLLVLPYIIPPYLGAIAWINLCNPSVGWINRLAGAPIFDIYSLAGIIWVESLFCYSFVFMACSAALDNSDASLEEAARMSGAGPLRVLMDVTLPLIRPAIIGAAFLVFATTAASFGVPYLLGKPARLSVLTTQIYGEVKSGRLDGHNSAAAISASLLVLALTGSWLARWLSGSGRITTLGGKTARPALVRLGAWRHVALGAAMAVVFLACILPLAAIVLTSLMKVGGQFDVHNFTVEKYVHVLHDRTETMRGFVLSLGLSTGAATLAIAAGAAIAYVTGHPRIKRIPLLTGFIQIPYATPGTILALGLVLVWSRPIRLTDTVWILMIAYFVKNLAFAVRSLTTNVQQVDITLEEAARMSGAGFWRTVATIWLPLLRPALLSGWFLVFIPSFSELTMSVVLAGPGTETVGTSLFHLQEYADPPSASVLATLILALVLAAYALALLFQRRGPKPAPASAPR